MPHSNTSFTTFALLYMIALLLELADNWTYRIVTLAALALVILTLSIRLTRITFLIFLVATTSYLVLLQFPDVANHANVAIYCSIVMMLGIVYSLVRKRDFPTDDDYFVMMRPVLQMTVILMYFLAGFHKLNADFLNPDVSCVTHFLAKLFAVARSDLAMVTVIFLVAWVSLVSCRRHSFRQARRYLAVVVGVGVVALIAVAALVVLKPPLETVSLAKTPLVLTGAVIVIAWEVLGGLLLAIPRVQAPMLIFSWAMHSIFALVDLVDFGALALALLFTFLPQSCRDLLDRRLRVAALGLSIHRAQLYAAVNAPVAILLGLDRSLAAGLLFNASALVLIWPILSGLAASRPRPDWPGVPLAIRTMPRWMMIFPLFLLLHGLTSYLGLRTAGNFSMFSNLRTEGIRSNHLLLQGNPLKYWHYQDDLVRFVDIDDRQARIGYQYRPLQGNQLPVVEFKKLIYAWTKTGRVIPITFEYRGEIHSTDDIVNDPVWRTPARDWDMLLMDFRVIQPVGPNRCRW
jgi:hypothetical protein